MLLSSLLPHCVQGIVGAFRPENIGRIVKVMGPKLTSNILNILGEHGLLGLLLLCVV